MKHPEWCGSHCSNCTKSCDLDESMPCSPDCDNFTNDGEVNEIVCRVDGCDSYRLNKLSCTVRLIDTGVTYDCNGGIDDIVDCILEEFNSSEITMYELFNKVELQGLTIMESREVYKAIDEKHKF